MPKRDPNIKEYKNKRSEGLFKFHLYLGLYINDKYYWTRVTKLL